jgi:hypothetical protein
MFNIILSHAQLIHGFSSTVKLCNGKALETYKLLYHPLRETGKTNSSIPASMHLHTVCVMPTGCRLDDKSKFN